MEVQLTINLVSIFFNPYLDQIKKEKYSLKHLSPEYIFGATTSHKFNV